MTDRLIAYIETLEGLLYSAGYDEYGDNDYTWASIREMRASAEVAGLLPSTPLEYWEQPDYVPPPPPDPNDPFVAWSKMMQEEDTPFLNFIRKMNKAAYEGDVFQFPVTTKTPVAREASSIEPEGAPE